MNTTNPEIFVEQFYDFALVFGGFLAFGAIVWGGTRYILAAGNPGTQGDARDQIFQAVIGLLLLFGAVFILNIVNPAIARTSIPALPTKLRPPLPPGQPQGCGSSCPQGSCVDGTCADTVVAVVCYVGNEYYFCGNPAVPCNLSCNSPNVCISVPAGLEPRFYCQTPDKKTL